MTDATEQSPDENELRERFAISPLIDLEIDVGGEGWVGLSPNSSHTLRQNVTASVIVERFGYSSVDYVRKRYVRELAEHQPRDFELRVLGAKHDFVYNDFYHSFQPARTNAPLGIFAFDLTMVRARSALELLLVTSRQGFLLEACVIARSIVEQLAYASYVSDKISDKDVFEVKPQSLIRSLLPVCESAGRAYGLLSQLSHYDPKTHYHFIGDQAGETVNHRSWRFKIIASAWTFFLFHLKFLVFESVYRDYPNFEIAAPLRGSALIAFDRHFDGVDNYWVKQIRALIA